jgi:hypothetical protein
MEDKDEETLPRPKKSYEEPGITPKIHLLWNTHYVFWANHQQLSQNLASFKEPGKAILLWHDHDQLEMFQLHIVRLLHNYLASAKTLVDHTRILVEELYKGTAFWAEYEAKKKESFVDSTLAQFMQNLRNYTLHRALPFTSTTMNLATGPEFDSFINLNLSQLRLWEGWSKKAKEYLNGSEEKIRLDEVTNGYTAIVEEFYNWFKKRQQELHYEW